jgi:hypothetical protein
MRKLSSLHLAPAMLVLLCGSLPGGSFKLPPKCKLPFDAIATKPDPWAACGMDGSGVHGAALQQDKVLEDRAKNNLCADAAGVTTVNFAILQKMQQQAPPKGPLATSRASLQNFFDVEGKKIGEGSVVRLLAYIKEAHISDCEAGEEVNCKTKGVAQNDFHIPLVDPAKPNARNLPECSSVTAEMIPHFRPAAWSQIDLKTPIVPVRVTGQLFFDNSHEPCQNGKPVGSNPARVSLWEIHPVYALDVCTEAQAARCDVNSKSSSMWVPYDQWVGAHPDQVQATGQKQRESCGGTGARRR